MKKTNKHIKLTKKQVFELFGTKIKIEYKDNVLDEEGHWMYGTAEHKADLTIITLSTKDADGKNLTKDSMIRTLRHELFHAILNKGMYFSSSSDEPMVEWLAICTDILCKQGLPI